MIIADLREQLDWRPVVIDRIWRAFWEPYGASLADLNAAMDDVLASQGFPFSLLALHKGRFLGTVTAIQSDIAARPDLGPCVAALWVEPEARGRGVARDLVAAALSRLSATGHERAYLAAKPRMHDYYVGLGWLLIERGVGDDSLDVFSRALP